MNTEIHYSNCVHEKTVTLDNVR